MITLNPFRQSEAMCGPASLKILLSHYGKDFTERELGELCGSTFEIGTTHQGLVDALVHLGLNPLAKEDATIDELRELVHQEIPVIVGWYKVDEDHYSVVYDIDGTTVSMMDPEEASGRMQMTIEEFEKVWHDFDSGSKRRTRHWLLTVS